MISRIVLRTLFVFSMAVLVAACQYYVPVAPSRGEASTVVQGNPFSDPFTSRTEGDDGIITEFGGNASGHAVERPSYFKLVLTNQSDAPWDGRYCLTLLSPHWRLEELAGEAFTLPAGSSASRELEVNFPADLDPGHYGLALIVVRPTGPTVQLNYIDVGMPDDGRPPELASIPEELVEIARARCAPATEAYPEGMIPVGAAAEDAVRLFYWDYLQAARPDAEGNRQNPPATGAYAESPYLAPGFVRQIESMVESGIDFDPFLCAQDVPTGFNISGATFEQDAVFVHVRTGVGSEFDVVVADQGDAWRIINVICK